MQTEPHPSSPPHALRQLSRFPARHASAVFEFMEPVEDEACLLRAARTTYRLRREREAEFDAGMFADPAWDIMLDLFVASLERRRVSVSSACIASAVPSTTALRSIAALERNGLVTRCPHPTDRRSAYLSLTSDAAARMLRYFAKDVRDSAS